jgi:hypothetical protein
MRSLLIGKKLMLKQLLSVVLETIAFFNDIFLVITKNNIIFESVET